MEKQTKLIEKLNSFIAGNSSKLSEIKEAAVDIQQDIENKNKQADKKHTFVSAKESFINEITEMVDGIITGKDEYNAAKETRLRELVGLLESTVFIDDNEILFSFTQEARKHLENLKDSVTALEENFDNNLIYSIYRPIHTIKGMSAFLGLEQTKKLTTLLEKLLNYVREEIITVDNKVLDLLLNGVDRLTFIINDLDTQAKNSQGIKGAPCEVKEKQDGVRQAIEKMEPFVSEIDEMIAADDKLIEEDTVEESSMTKKQDEKTEAVKTPSISIGEDDFLIKASNEREDISDGPRSGQGESTAKKINTAADYPEELVTQEMVQKFVEESLDLIDTAENAILVLEKNPENKEKLEEAFRQVHTIKGNAGFFWYGYIENVCMGIETVLDALRKEERKATGKIINLLLESIDSLRGSLHKVLNGEIKPGPAENAVAAPHDKEQEEDYEDYEPLGDLLVEMGVATRDQVDKALELQQMRLGEILVTQEGVDDTAVRSALEKQEQISGEKKDQLSSYRVKRRDIRVDTERLDKLFDLMGELITAEAMVINNPDLAELELPAFDQAAVHLSKISREMQEITMSIRMIPLDGLFNKMRRLVRDLSKKFDKEIHLLVSGEETEMDRNVMEEISDPLVHLIRNGIDHGIESPDIRRKAGKSPMGAITLNARYEGNEIWITIADNGGGLDKDKILKRAQERGILNQTSEELSDREIYKLVFEPGFSTAEQVSEISGRGVGMDVVKRNIEKLHGKIDIQSEKGQGTTIILKIPLTLAIIEGIVFTVGNQIYALPIGDIIEFHKASQNEITKTEDQEEVVRLRKELMPIIKLYRFFKIETDIKEIDQGIVVVMSAAGKKVALLADDIIGYRQLVIKALPSYMGQLRAISGCSIMADGMVSLIIDASALISYILE